MMFHTPPVKSDWEAETSIANSYDSHSSGSSTSNLANKATNEIVTEDNNDTVNDSDSQPVTLETNETRDMLQSVDTNQSDVNLHGHSKGEDIGVKSYTPAIEVHDDLLDLDMHIGNATTDATTVTTSKTSIMNSTSVAAKSESSSYIESFEVPTEEDLPIQLVKIYEGFLKELKEPKFDRALASFEIAEIFQNFYQRFQHPCQEYIESEGKYELQNQQVSEDSSHQYYRYNLILERLLCDKFYTQIVFPLKEIEIDEFEKAFNDEFSDKLGCLGSLHINFRNLDIDLPEELEYEFQRQLEERVLTEFELLTAERSPTLKMKYLIKIHKTIGQIVNDLKLKSSSLNGSDGKHKPIILNTDMYLPLLIYSLIKLKEVRNYFLIKQLNFMKRFCNEHIFDKSNESLQHERGKLLYVCANFEAAISYLSSVTLDNLELEIPSEDINLLPGSMKSREELLGLLTMPLKMESLETKVEEFKQHTPLHLTNDAVSIHSNGNTSNINSLIGFNKTFNTFTNTFIDYSKVSLPDSVINADQGIKTISQVVDSSLKNIMGKVSVSFLGGSVDEIPTEAELSSSQMDVEHNDTIDEGHNRNSSVYTLNDGEFENSLSKTLLEQLAENEAFNASNNAKTQVVSPSRMPTQQAPASVTLTTTNASNINFTHSNTKFPSPLRRKTSVEDVESQEGILSKFTTSMGGVMKNFRPASASSSSTSLDANVADATAATVTEPSSSLNAITAIRSRTTSFKSPSMASMASLISTSPTKERRNTIMNSIENAFDNVRNRSRDNSLQISSQSQLQQLASSQPRADPVLVPLTKPFDALTVGELRELYDRYQTAALAGVEKLSSSPP